jgi:hypothetical protein
MGGGRAPVAEDPEVAAPGEQPGARHGRSGGPSRIDCVDSGAARFAVVRGTLREPVAGLPHARIGPYPMT